jgi:hypothetical protein
MSSLGYSSIKTSLPRLRPSRPWPFVTFDPLIHHFLDIAQVAFRTVRRQKMCFCRPRRPIETSLSRPRKSRILGPKKGTKNFSGSFDPLKHRFLDLVEVEIWDGQKVENEFLGQYDNLKRPFLHRAKVALWPGQKAENAFASPLDPFKHSFLHFKQHAFCDFDGQVDPSLTRPRPILIFCVTE